MNIIYLYSGSPSDSLNHSTIETESSRSKGSMSHGREAFFDKTPWTSDIGTETGKNKKNYTLETSIFLFYNGDLRYGRRCGIVQKFEKRRISPSNVNRILLVFTPGEIIVANLRIFREIFRHPTPLPTLPSYIFSCCCCSSKEAAA